LKTIPEKSTAGTAQRKVKASPRQLQFAYLIILLNVVLLLIMARHASDPLYPWLFGLLFGFVLQRSRFCFAAASRDIFLIRNTMITRALIVAFIVASLGFLSLEILTPGVELLFTQGKVQPVGVFTAFGAFLFGIGMVIAGGCASGMLMRMGEGYMMQWLVLPGFLLGSAVGAWHLSWWYEQFIAAAPAIFLPHLLGWPLAVLLQFSILIALFIIACAYQDGWQGLLSPCVKRFKSFPKFRAGTRSTRHGDNKGLYLLLLKKPWPYTVGGIVLAGLNTIYFALWGIPWGITDGMTFFSAWIASLWGLSPEHWHYFKGIIPIDACCLPDIQTAKGIEYFAFPLIYHFMAIITGAFIASLLAGEFRIRKWRSNRFVLAALIGGMLMGYGSRVALGCNIGAYFSAIPSFSLHGWIFGIFIIAGAYLGGRVLLRFLVD
jgi:uncharacterized protein